MPVNPPTVGRVSVVEPLPPESSNGSVVEAEVGLGVGVGPVGIGVGVVVGPVVGVGVGLGVTVGSGVGVTLGVGDGVGVAWPIGATEFDEPDEVQPKATAAVPTTSDT